MIEWQGAPPPTESLAPYARLYRRTLSASLLMFALVSALNIGSWALSKADADVVLYPVFVGWAFFYLLLLQLMLNSPNDPLAPGKLGILLVGILNLPIAYLSTMALQTPALYAQVSMAKFISSAFS